MGDGVKFSVRAGEGGELGVERVDGRLRLKVTARLDGGMRVTVGIVFDDDGQALALAWRLRELVDGCGLCGVAITNGGVTCSRGCPGDDGRGVERLAGHGTRRTGGGA